MLPLLTRIDHVGIACRDLEKAISLYKTTFGLEVVSLEVHEDQGVREAMLQVCGPAHDPGALSAGRSGDDLHPPAPSGLASDTHAPAGLASGTPVPAGLAVPPVECYVQLLEPLGPDTPVGKFLARRGEGIHHIAYGVTDITQALAAIGATDVRLLDERPRHGSLGASIAFLHPADLSGVLTELVQSRPRE